MSSRLPSPAFVTALGACVAQPFTLDDRWSLWRLYAVRGAGFPIALLEDFAAPALRMQIDALVAAAACARTARARLHAHLKACLDLDGGLPGRPYHRALKAVQKQRHAIDLPADDVAGMRLAAVHAEAAQAEYDARAAYRAAFARCDLDLIDVARGFAAREDFRAAVAWQNGAALAQLTRYFAAHPTAEDRGEARQYRRLVASYVQRYCAKNEQIGFFGPVGWGCVDGDRATLVAAPEVVREVRPYFEYWAVAALADRAARLVPGALTPRLSPGVRLEAHGLVLPDAVLPLDAVQREFLTALDGTLSVDALVARYAGRAGTGLENAAAVHALLGQLVTTDIVDWRLPLPVTPEAGDTLGAALARIPALAGFAAQWRALDAARAALAKAALSEVPARIARIDTAFADLADTPARRLGGNAYAGRTPLYADAVREIELTLPESVFARIAPALVPVLDSAQWFVQRLLEQYLAYVVATWRSLEGGGAVPLGVLWSVLQEETETALAIGEDVVEQLQERWRLVLPIDAAARVQHFDVGQVAARARDVFSMPAGVWSGARFQAPDLLLAAQDIADFDGDAWCAVLGEIHPCTNLMLQTVTAKLCPVREAALAASARVQDQPELIPAIARDARGHRTAYSLELPHDFTLEHGASRAACAPSQILRLADLVVRDDGAGPHISSLDDARSWPLAQFFGPQLRSIGISRFKPLRVDEHLPRLQIGPLVLERESWRIPRAALDFVGIKDRADRLLALHRWARTLGLPRHSFYRVPDELKPWYLDLDSPVYCELFMDSVRKRAEGVVALGEMLPGPDQCWLTDGRGRRYTAELRMAAHTRA